MSNASRRFPVIGSAWFAVHTASAIAAAAANGRQSARK
jgi:hypothetical protein